MRSFKRVLVRGAILLTLFQFLRLYIVGPDSTRNVSPRDIKTTEPTGYFLAKCNCTKHLNTAKMVSKHSNLTSTCSEEANWLGKGQRIVSYSLYNNPKGTSDQTFQTFLNGIVLNVRELKVFYPGWIIRLYSNYEVLCQYACIEEVTWCDIKEYPFGNIKYTNPRLWRFLPLGDTTVEIFVSRDLDSLITEREREIVSEWESSNFTFHCARDKEWSEKAMLAGVWGAKNTGLDPEESVKLREKFIKRGTNNTEVGLDEELLEELIFREYNKSILAHDSYHCMDKRVVPSVPFPKQRKNVHTWVAISSLYWNYTSSTYSATECPVACRPSYGKHWKYC